MTASLNNLAKQVLRSTPIYNAESLDIHVQNAPLLLFIDTLVQTALRENISDIHIEPNAQELAIRFRRDGELFTYGKFPLAIHPLLIARLKVMASLNTIERKKPQDGSFFFQYQGEKIDIRLSFIRLIYGEKCVLRLLNTLNHCYSLSELQFSSFNLQILEDILTHNNGLFLTVGPVNSGKTTTLYAALKTLLSPQKNIVTIEDPVEYRLNGINQINIYPQLGLSFREILRSLLRQDPDIIMLGEIRDKETAIIALRAALTGRLLLSTLHATNAINAIYRLLELGLPPYLLSATLLGILAQRLLKRNCPHCLTKQTSFSTSEEKFLCQHSLTPPFYRGQGCEKCHFTGTLGRIAIQEILFLKKNIDINKLQKGNINITQFLFQRNFHSLQADAQEKFQRGEISLQELRSLKIC